MLESISLTGRNPAGAGNRGGAYGSMPELQFPGIGGQSMALYASDRPDHQPQKIELSQEEAVTLALAVVGQAIRDARSTSYMKTFERDHARTWLLSDGATWLQAAGKAITQADLERWLSGGCPNWGSTRTI